MEAKESETKTAWHMDYPLLLTSDEPCLRLYSALRKEVSKTITMQYLKTNHLETEDRSTSFANTLSYGGP